MPRQTILDALFHPRPKATLERDAAETLPPTPVSPASALDVPVVSIDLESTGTNIGSDKIVQLSLVRFEPRGTTETFTTYVNPGRPIPPQATTIHHITDEMVAQAPAFNRERRSASWAWGELAAASRRLDASSACACSPGGRP